VYIAGVIVHFRYRPTTKGLEPPMHRVFCSGDISAILDRICKIIISTLKSWNFSPSAMMDEMVFPDPFFRVWVFPFGVADI